jgi:hypothetical protein
MVAKIKHFDEISEKCDEVSKRLDKKRGTIEGTDKMMRIKKTLAVLKLE